MHVYVTTGGVFARDRHPIPLQSHQLTARPAALPAITLPESMEAAVR